MITGCYIQDKGINGARLHFVRKRTFSGRKWGLSPFIPKTCSNHAFGDASLTPLTSN